MGSRHFDWNALEDRIAAVMEAYDELNRTKALAVITACEVFDIDSEEAVDCITDGANDRGVDLFYIDDRENKNNIHLLQAKCVDVFDRSKRNFPGNEVDKLTSFVNDLATENDEALAIVNERLRVKIADALEIQKKANATITVHFVGNMEPLVEEEHQRIEAAFARYRAIGFEMHSLESIADYFLEREAPNLTRSLTAIDTNFFDRTDQNLRGMVCTVAATDIVNMIRSESNPEAVEPAIFDQNVRVYLKNKNRINNAIIESALDETNHMFWYQNNGITMTSDKIEIAPAKRSPEIRMTNVQIVNGGQTSHCLFEAAQEDNDRLSDALLLVRIIETSSEDVKLSIAETTNSQTPINVRDLKSNDRHQRQLEQSFADIGCYYERKRFQHIAQNRADRIDALDAGQAFLAYGVGLPEVAKKDRGRVFGDLYETVFSDEVSAPKLLTSFQLMCAINEQKKIVRRKIRDEVALAAGEIALIDGAFHALFAVRQICFRDSVDQWDVDQARAKVDEAIQVVGRIYVAAQAGDENFSSNRFFKDMRTKDLVTTEVG